MVGVGGLLGARTQTYPELGAGEAKRRGRPAGKRQRRKQPGNQTIRSPEGEAAWKGIKSPNRFFSLSLSLFPPSPRQPALETWGSGRLRCPAAVPVPLGSPSPAGLAGREGGESAAVGAMPVHALSYRKGELGPRVFLLITQPKAGLLAINTSSSLPGSSVAASASFWGPLDRGKSPPSPPHRTR